MKISIKNHRKFHDNFMMNFLCLCVSFSARDDMRLQNFGLEVSLIEKNIHSYLNSSDVRFADPGRRYRGPAGRLDTLHVLSERG